MTAEFVTPVEILCGGGLLTIIIVSVTLYRANKEAEKIEKYNQVTAGIKRMYDQQEIKDKHDDRVTHILGSPNLPIDEEVAAVHFLSDPTRQN